MSTTSPPSRGGHMRGSYSRPSGGGGAEGGGSQRTLGTFSGVYIPCVNSIFGVVLFLRWGWAVGQIGVSGALAVLLLGTLISFVTAAHVSALATNGEVETGGAYFLLSRALGPEFGGAVGFLFYIAQAFAVGLYTLGFTEAVLPLLEDSPVMSRVLPCSYYTGPACAGERFLYPNEEVVSSALMLLLLGINMLGTHWFARVSKLIFLGVLFGVLSGLGSIIAYSITYDEIEDLMPPNNVTGFVGISWARLQTNWGQELVCEQDDCVGVLTTFYVVGVILPAVTGLLNGASMSGDLKDPGHSIPTGTLYAVITMVFVYSSVIVLQGAAFERTELRSNYVTLQQITFFPPIVLTATVFATVSPALTTMAGMSRILQAQAKDGMYGKRISAVLSKGYGPRSEPRWCFVLSWFLGQLVCLFGEVNLAATFVTIFFFTTYAALNFACAVLIISGAPNFRPEFKWYSWPISLVGTVLCIMVGFVVDTRIASASLVLAFVVFFVLSVSRAGQEHNFAEVSQALIYQFSHRYLLTLDLRKAHPKFWRPQVLVLIEGPAAQSRELCDVAPIIGLAHQLRSASSGLLVVGQVLEGVVTPVDPAATSEEEPQQPARIDQTTVAAATEALVELVEGALGENIAFATVTVARNFIDGVLGLMLGGGLGPIRPNTVVMPFPSPADKEGERNTSSNGDETIEPPSGLGAWAGTVRAAAALGRTVVATRGFEIGGFVPETSDAGDDTPRSDDSEDTATSFSGGFQRFRSSVSMMMPARGSGLLLPGGARLGGDHIPRIVEEIFPREQGGPPLLDFRVDLAQHGPRAGLTVDVWVLDGWAAAAALRATGQLEVEAALDGSVSSASLSEPHKDRLRKLSAGSLNDDEEAATPGSSFTGPMRDGPHAASLLWESFQARTLVLLQLGFLLHLDPFWLRYTRLRILVLVPPAPSVERDWLLKRIAEMTRGARISADIVPVDETADSPPTGDAVSLGMARATAVNGVIRSMSNAKAGMILLQAGAIHAASSPLAAGGGGGGGGRGAPAEANVSVEAGSDNDVSGDGAARDLALWHNMEALSSGLRVPAMLVFANDEQVTTEQL
jgi:amino acid transporter